EAAFNIDVNVLLSQGDKCDLPIFEASKPVEAPKDQRNVAERPFRFVIYWRKTSSSWLRQVPVVIWTSPRDVERIAEGCYRRLQRVTRSAPGNSPAIPLRAGCFDKTLLAAFDKFWQSDACQTLRNP